MLDDIEHLKSRRKVPLTTTLLISSFRFPKAFTYSKYFFPPLETSLRAVYPSVVCFRVSGQQLENITPEASGIFHPTAGICGKSENKWVHPSERYKKTGTIPRHIWPYNELKPIWGQPCGSITRAGKTVLNFDFSRTVSSIKYTVLTTLSSTFDLVSFFFPSVCGCLASCLNHLNTEAGKWFKSGKRKTFMVLAASFTFAGHLSYWTIYD